jgi:Domain of unknown function (DUF4471)
VAEYNLYAMIYKLERGKEYHLNWDGIDNGKVKRADKEKDVKEKIMDTIDEEGEDAQTEETKDTDAQNETSKEKSKVNEEKIDEKKPEEEFSKKNEAEEVQAQPQEMTEEGESTFITEKKQHDISQKFASGIVDGLKEIKIRILPLSDGIEKLSGKKKFQGLFDVIVNGFLQAVTLKNDNLTKMLVPKSGIIYQENAQ